MYDMMNNMMYNWQDWRDMWPGSWMMADWAIMGAGFAVFILVCIWSLSWKGVALWKAARSGSTGWFVALLIINTVGILDILYIYVFSKKYKNVD